uniref:Fibronectin type-III domain-containing protein n=1 Tax=Romanomermis culicivorax TaxID=13658 RepID=A0A915KDT8_ROMCU
MDVHKSFQFERLFVEDHSPFWIYLRWNKSATEMPLGEYFLEYYPTSSENITDRKALKYYRRSFLPTIATFYRIINLEPDTNYSFCLLYSKMGKILYKSCVDGSTAELVVGFGTTANYTLMFLFLFCTFSTLVVCLVKCLYRYFNIWQESKHKGRMQETLSTQSFLSSAAGSRRCSTVYGEVITFENMATTIENGAREKIQETDVDKGDIFQENGNRLTVGQEHVGAQRISATNFLQMTMDHKNSPLCRIRLSFYQTRKNLKKAFLS